MGVGRRTLIDFTGHELEITDENGLKIHYLKKKGTIVNSVKFINTNGILVVTGDFGNWIFCREFTPSEGGYVSDGYWAEKLEIYSVQKAYKYDSEATLKALKERIKELKEYGYSKEKRSEAKEYYKECIDLVDEELDYTYYAYRNFPSFMDYENVVFETTIHYRLKVIFDAFEEICLRLKSE